MTSHQLAIAKASFSVGLLRPDPVVVTREEIGRFHSLLKAVTIKCSSENVQKCKQWILENIFQSAARSSALGKYLTTFTASLGTSEGKKEPRLEREPSVRRQRLHLTYLVNDLLYHGKYRGNDASICSKIQPMLMSLFGSCASFRGYPKHNRKILDLLDLWTDKDYYSPDFIDRLRETVANAQEAGQHIEASTDPASKIDGNLRSKSTPYVMPASHGDPMTPWYDLPAGNLMPHIVPNSTRPINPDLIKPLRFLAGPADEILVQAVKNLLDDVEIIFGKELDHEDKIPNDVDELGQIIIIDEITGDVIDGEGYYGWSRKFCEKMKNRKNGFGSTRNDQGRDYERNRSSSPEVRKRRYSSSDESPDNSRRRRRQSYSSSRSMSPVERRNENSQMGLSSKSRSRSRSLSVEETSNMTIQSDGAPCQPQITQNLFPQNHGVNANFPPFIPPSFQNAPFSVPNQQYGFSQPPRQLPQNQISANWPTPSPGNLASNFHTPQLGQLHQQPNQNPQYGPSGWQRNYGNSYGRNSAYRGGRGGHRGRGW